MTRDLPRYTRDETPPDLGDTGDWTGRGRAVLPGAVAVGMRVEMPEWSSVIIYAPLYRRIDTVPVFATWGDVPADLGFKSRNQWAEAGRRIHKDATPDAFVWSYQPWRRRRFGDDIRVALFGPVLRDAPTGDVPADAHILTADDLAAMTAAAARR